MRVLVTGASGFLGSHVCRHFAEQGHTIAAVGRPETTLPDPAFVGVLERFGPDLVVHCAASARVSESLEQPYRDFSSSVDVCAFVLDALRVAAPRATFVLLSSAAVYGRPAHVPIDETTAVSPLSPYGYHKRLCELLVEEYRALYGLRALVLRVCSAYGEGQKRQVIFDLHRKLCGDAPELRLYGTGSESRDFIHARDVAQAVERAATAAGEHWLYLAGSGVETAIADVAALLSEQLGVHKPIVWSGDRLPGSPPARWRADIARLSAAGFQPRVTLRDGLAAYCRWLASGG